MFFLVFAHINADHGAFIVEHEFSQGACQFGLSHTGRAQEDERTKWPVRVLQTGPGAAQGVRDGLQGILLSDYSFSQPIFHVQEFLGLAFKEF